jgi:hypothetical protein
LTKLTINKKKKLKLFIFFTLGDILIILLLIIILSQPKLFQANPIMLNALFEKIKYVFGLKASNFSCE